MNIISTNKTKYHNDVRGSHSLYVDVVDPLYESREEYIKALEKGSYDVLERKKESKKPVEKSGFMKIIRFLFTRQN